MSLMDDFKDTCTMIEKLRKPDGEGDEPKKVNRKS